MKNLSYINPKGELRVESTFARRHTNYLIDGIETCELFPSNLMLQDKEAVILLDTNIRLDWSMKH